MSMQKVKAGRENWVKDSDVTNCSMCMATFGCVTRKHHCRACGNVFCASCSASAISFTPSTRKNEEGYKEKKKRVCTACYKNLDDVQRRLEKAMRASGGGSRLDLGSFLNPNSLLSFCGNSFQADAGKKAGQVAKEAAPQGPALALPLFSLNPFSWGGSSRGRATAAERESATGHMDAEAAFLTVQQEQERHSDGPEPAQECSPEGSESGHMDTEAALATVQQEPEWHSGGVLEPVQERSPEGSTGSEAGEKCSDCDPCGGEEEEAEMQELFSFYLSKLQEQKAVLEAKLQAQQESEGDSAETPLQAEAEAVDKQFDMVMRSSNLYDEASPGLDFGRLLCDEDACAQPEAETPEQGVQDLGVGESDRAKLLKLSLTVLKLSLKFEYRRKMMCDTGVSETCGSTECPSQAQEVS